MVCGGVAANRGLRAALAVAAQEDGFALHIPPPKYCTDNAAMIAAAGDAALRPGGARGLDLAVDPGCRSGAGAMRPDATAEDPRRVLARHGLAAKKSWGQNFLHDRSVLARIVAAAGATAADIVVEIGAGLGTLTAALAQAAPPPARILAVERDPDMQRVLAAELGGDVRVEVVAADALAFDYAAVSRAAGRPVIVVGNLPYQISSALVLALVDAGARGGVARAVVMVQREMAQRIVAPPGSRTYGRLRWRSRSTPRRASCFTSVPARFIPRPR